ncbi:hypothetical protein [Aurantiacibacter luteus]|uniref:Tail tape measure protein n=1 Tax=Aurantiacibacter luteus TaxID=1581420 RepID=A0A0G9MUS7_9SPHN|nr:hypothetical protein [Aurantiacibacter luteus]KLE34460.1 tail tape measure protein [Aurantiacibacter luteus]
MDDEIDTLLVEVRANTSGFRSDIEAMRSGLDSSLTDGFARAGDVLERSLLSAIRRGKLGFDELKSVALGAMSEIAAQALRSGLGTLLGGGNGSAGGGSAGGMGAVLSGLFGSLLGLPGRATGGPVAPGAAYIVGERGPEVFVPTSAGRVETGARFGQQQQRDVRVSIALAPERGASGPVMLRRSSRQVASAVARAMRNF